MEPDLEKLLKDFSEANEAISTALIKQSLAWNRLSNCLRELRENQPNLFTDDKDN